MALTVKQLIEKLQTVKNQETLVLYETPEDINSVDRAYIDGLGYVVLYNLTESCVCDCEHCKETNKEL